MSASPVAWIRIVLSHDVEGTLDRVNTGNYTCGAIHAADCPPSIVVDEDLTRLGPTLASISGQPLHDLFLSLVVIDSFLRSTHRVLAGSAELCIAPRMLVLNSDRGFGACRKATY